MQKVVKVGRVTVGITAWCFGGFKQGERAQNWVFELKILTGIFYPFDVIVGEFGRFLIKNETFGFMFLKINLNN